MDMTNVHFRTEAALKEQAERLFDEMGLNMTAALNVFLKAAVREGRIPFELVGQDAALKKEIREKLLEAQKYANQPNAVRYGKKDFFKKVRTELL